MEKDKELSELVSKCVLRVEVNSNENPLQSEAASTDPQTHRKSGDITVETYPSRLESPRDDWGLLPATSRETTPSNTETNPIDQRQEIGFFSGNPFVEITKGILHLYKEDSLTDRKEASVLCLLGVPTSMTCHDLLAFTAPCHADISHIRVLRDSTPNQYMTLLTFRNHEFAMQFYKTFNGEPYNTLEPEYLCRIVWVSRVEWACDGAPPPGHTELPICPVCLERMDESVDGVLTILCNHAFHANCLEQWGDSTCPVCRCVQSPEQEASSRCEQCASGMDTPTSADSLWICLICGHVGCGRYQGGHAALHYRQSGHCYALQLGSHRVWDYKGDNFVHRLLQNKADGKLVASEGPPSEAEREQEKVDAVQLEFTYLLTSQLDEQRMYFEEKLARLESRFDEEKEIYNQNLTILNDEIVELKKKLLLLTKDKQGLEKKLLQQNSRLSTAHNELNEERQLGKALRNNQSQWQERVRHLQQELNDLKQMKDDEIRDLREQIRDLMFFINGQEEIAKLSKTDENIAGATVTLSDGTSNNPKKSHRRKNR